MDNRKAFPYRVKYLNPDKPRSRFTHRTGTALRSAYDGNYLVVLWDGLKSGQYVPKKHCRAFPFHPVTHEQTKKEDTL